jgi:hypothetical protein
MLHDASGGGPALTPPGQLSGFVQNDGPVALVSLAGEDGDCADGSDDGWKGLLESLHAVVTHAAAMATALMNCHFMIVLSPDTGAGHLLRMVAAQVAGRWSRFCQFQCGQRLESQAKR